MKDQHKAELAALRKIPNENRAADIHSDTNVRLSSGLPEHNSLKHLFFFSFYAQQKKVQRLPELPITGLHSGGVREFEIMSSNVSHKHGLKMIPTLDPLEHHH